MSRQTLRYLVTAHVELPTYDDAEEESFVHEALENIEHDLIEDIEERTARQLDRYLRDEGIVNDGINVSVKVS